MLEFRLVGLIITMIYIVYLVITYKKKTIFRHILEASLMFYICSVINLTIFPIPYEEASIMIEKQLGYSEHNFIPFNFLQGFVWGVPVYGNLLLLFPLSFYLLLLNKRLKLSIIGILTFFVSLLIELTQFLISLKSGYVYRTFDVDDLFLNTLGAILGFLVAKFIFNKLRYKFNLDLNDLFKKQNNKVA